MVVLTESWPVTIIYLIVVDSCVIWFHFWGYINSSRSWTKQHFVDTDHHSWQLVDTHIHQPVCVDAHACLTHTLQASMWVRTWQGSMNNEGRCIIGNILKDITVMMILMIICSTNPTRTSSRYNTAIISTYYSPYHMMATCGSMLIWQNQSRTWGWSLQIVNESIMSCVVRESCSTS